MEHEQKVVKALSALSPSKTAETLRAESIEVIEQVLGCSNEEAAMILRDREARKLIVANISHGGELDARRPMPVAKWHWEKSKGS